MDDMLKLCYKDLKSSLIEVVAYPARQNFDKNDTKNLKYFKTFLSIFACTSGLTLKP